MSKIENTIAGVNKILSETDEYDGVLWDVLTLLKEQSERIGVLERTIAQMPKPVKLLDAFGNGYAKVVRCKDCEHATMTSDGTMCKYCAMDTDDFGDQRDVYHDANWYCADGERRTDDA